MGGIDPTNVAFLNGYEGGNLGQGSTTNQRNLRWVGKLGGMYRFPWQITAAGLRAYMISRLTEPETEMHASARSMISGVRPT